MGKCSEPRWSPAGGRKEGVFVKSAYLQLGHLLLRLSQVSMMSAVSLLMAVSGLSVSSAEAAETPSIIPQPATVKPGPGSFRLMNGGTIVVDDLSGRLAGVGRILQETLEQYAGLRLAVDEGRPATEAGGTIRLTLVPGRADLGPEGYDLTVAPQGVVIRGAERTGVFWGTQSLLQIVELQLALGHLASGQR